jgi:hypothetical protein
MQANESQQNSTTSNGEKYQYEGWPLNELRSVLDQWDSVSSIFDLDRVATVFILILE